MAAVWYSRLKNEAIVNRLRNAAFRQRCLYALLVAAYVCLILAQINRSAAIREFPDTRTYNEVAASPLLSLSFWGGARPPLVPLVIKILHASPGLVRAAQWGGAAICWAFLGIVLAGCMNTLAAKFFCLAAVLLFSLTDKVILWHDAFLSESLCISILAGLAASWALFLKHKTGGGFALVLGFSLLSVLVRDTMAYLLLSLAAIIGAWLLFGRVWRPRKSNRLGLCLCCSFVILFLGSLASHNAGRRWVFPFYNIISQRVLTQPSALEFFNDHGMPVTGDLLSRAHKWGSSDNFYFYNSPGLEPFRQWVFAKGRWIYINYLLRHPYHFVRDPSRDFGKVLSARFGNYAADRFRSVIPIKNRRGAHSRSAMPKVLFFSACILGAFSLSCRNAGSRMILFPVMLAGTAFIHLFVAWHGDAMEVLRHCLTAGLQFELAMVIAAAMFFDQLLLSIPVMSGKLSGGAIKLITSIARRT